MDKRAYYQQREVVDAFLQAVRDGNLEGLLAILDPDAVIRIDAAMRVRDPHAVAPGTDRIITGASTWATQLIAMTRGIRGPQFVQPALINDSVGVVIAPGGKLSQVLMFRFRDDKITRLDAIANPATLRELEIAVL